MAQWVKNMPANAEGMSSVLGLGRSSEGGNGNRLLYSCLENPMDKEPGGSGVQRQRSPKPLTWILSWALLSDWLI